MANRDLYEVLGVSRGASVDEIRRAYRKLARELHPDVNKAADASKRFAEVQEAYEALSDEKKRSLYDTYGSVETRAAEARDPESPHYSWSNVAGNGPFVARPFGGPGGVTDADDLGSVFEAIFGGGPDGMGSPHSNPRSRSSSKKSQRPAAPKGSPPDAVEQSIRVPFLMAARGGTEQIKISENGKSRTIEVTIPPGINNGGQLRVRGAASARGVGRDLLLTVHVDGHSLFRRGEFEETGRGLDLYLDLPVTITEATLGAGIVVPTLNDAVEVTLPPGTPSGKKLRLRGKGIVDPSGLSGDLFAIVRIVPPDPANLSEEEQRLLRSLGGRGADVRPGPRWPGGKGRS